MSATAIINGKPRKQLCDQLDRLDGIIDLLADNLNQAVADAAREGAKTAVKEIVTELVADPTVQELLRTVASPPAMSTPRTDRWAKLKGVVRVLTDCITSRAKSAAATAVRWAHAASTKVATPMNRIRAAWFVASSAVRVAASVPTPARKAVAIGIGVGIAVAVAAWVSPAVAALASGTTAGVAAAGVSAGVKLWDTFRSLNLS